mgnify:CR=1 FL=1
MPNSRKKTTAATLAKKKGKTGQMRKQTHLSAQTKRNQAKRDGKGSKK